MDFFKDLSKKVEGVAKSTAKKSAELVEVTKTNISISAENERINDLFGDIGRILFNKFQTEKCEDEELNVLFEKIKAHQHNIGVLRTKLADLKNVTVCPSCGVDNNKDASFCGKCGSKLLDDVTPEFDDSSDDSTTEDN